MKVLTEFEDKSLLFEKPEAIISCFGPDTFRATFKDLEAALKKGYYLAGWLAYEAGYCFEEKLNQNKYYDFPLIYLGVYKRPRLEFFYRQSLTSSSLPEGFPEDLHLNLKKDEYSSAIKIIRDYIAKGDVYQITYCIKLLFKFKGNPFMLYRRLLTNQRMPYQAYIETDKFSILSLSPEMFIKKTGQHIVTKPMKGTWPRGEGKLADLFAPWRLKFDPKNRAENVMIADLLRNDLGRVGLNIKAPKLFEVARYKTLCQMTSTVKAKVAKDIGIYQLLAALFPSGSVTGAPKIRAMEIIRQLEREERKIYTGAIGYISPDKDMFFNIPIRTILIQGSQAEMGIGGGIVWDSTAQGEWDEGLLKAKFLTDLSKTPFLPD